ncbi:MAG: tryptophan--tRNA ligase, partial [Trueperaceae bacterium]|nr:tryptophan--tRNA ligase [Trueperaceae bacterium]
AKMSKSVEAERPGHAINLLDDPKTLKKSIMAAVTDSEREVRFEHASPGVRNLLTIFHVLSGRPMADISAEFEGAGYGPLKRALVEVVTTSLAPLQERYNELISDTKRLDGILEDGAARARAIASRTIARAKEAMGVG